MSQEIIDWETHFYSQQLFDFVKGRTEHPYYHYSEEHRSYRMEYCPGVAVSHGETLLKNLLDISENRIAQMDEVGITRQILSLSEPGTEWLYNDSNTALSIVKDANDILYEATQKFPDRFSGFAALAPQTPVESAKELERCIDELGFIGWLTHANYGEDKYLDDKVYMPILEVCADRDIPIYLHPTIPEMEPFWKYGFSLAGSALGFQYCTAMCLMRMILGGVFDQFPKLKIILGHMGETLPFLMERLDFSYTKPWFDKGDRPDLERIPSQVLRDNVYVTTSGRFYEPLLKYCIEAMGIEHMMFATDFPYESMEESVNFISNANISPSEKEAIFSANAARFF